MNVIFMLYKLRDENVTRQNKNSKNKIKRKKKFFFHLNKIRDAVFHIFFFSLW